jgi:hypothetical protein
VLMNRGNKRIGFKIDVVLVRHKTRPRQERRQHDKKRRIGESGSDWLVSRKQADSISCMHNRHGEL